MNPVIISLNTKIVHFKSWYQKMRFFVCKLMLCMLESFSLQINKFYKHHGVVWLWCSNIQTNRHTTNNNIIIIEISL